MKGEQEDEYICGQPFNSHASDSQTQTGEAAKLLVFTQLGAMNKLQMIHRWCFIPAGLQRTFFLIDTLRQTCCREISFSLRGPTPKHSGEKPAAQSLPCRSESIPSEPLVRLISAVCRYLRVCVYSCFQLLVSVLHLCEGKYLYSCPIVPPPLAAPLNMWDMWWERKYSTISDCLHRGGDVQSP